VEIDTILCNHAEAAENKLFLTGGGITMCFVASNLPHIVTVALGNIVHVPYQATNQAHKLSVRLIDEDGQPVIPFHPEGTPEPPPVALEVPFNIGRPPFISVGDEQTIALAVNFTNLPLARLGLYTFVIEIDGNEMRRVPFRVLLPPQGLGGLVIPGAPVPGPPSP